MKLLLHIGLAKTGTSYIQSILACSAENIKNNGILYPEHSSFKAARTGKITSGNITGDNKLKKIDAFLSKPGSQVLDKALFSSEGLYPEILTNLSTFYSLCDKYDVHILMLLRDPIEHAMSIYIQKVKRQGFTGSLSDFISAYNTPASVLKLIKRIEEKCTIHMYNYSRHKEDLLSVMASYLGVDRSIFSSPSQLIVNRSLSVPEIALQRLFNKHFGKVSHKFVSDVLCNCFTEPCGDEPRLLPSQKDAQDLIKRIQPCVLELNSYLQDEEKLNFIIPDNTKDQHSSTITLSEEKFDMIISEIATHLNVNHE